MENEVRFLYLDDIIPNRFQPRENFDEQALKELAVSIKEHGVIQPIVVRQIGDKYEIIAGERRYKASTMAGLTKIPAIIKNLDDKESSKVALIENLQRKDLTPIEEARTYQKILELDALTQEELARTMGKSQSAVSNKLRLLALTDEVQDALLHEQISERHARSLLNITEKQKQVELLNKVINNRMTVRELDQEIKQTNGEDLTDENNMEVTFNNNESLNEMSTNQLPVENKVEEIIVPTAVDTDKTKNETIHIDIVNNEPFEVSNLLNPTEKKEDLTKTNLINVEELESDSKHKEDVIGGSGLLAGMTLDNSLVQPRNEFSSSLYQNFNVQSIDNAPTSNLFENAESNVVLNNGQNSNNADSSVKSIKDAINNIKNINKNIEMEEFDFDDFYQIVIRIDKN